MDAVVAIEGGRAICRKLRDVRAGDRVVCGVSGIRVTPEFQERDRHGFAFMANEISSERRVEVGVGRIADMMRDIKASGGKIAVVAGPVIVHTGGATHFQELIRAGFVDVLLSGNALAVHDVVDRRDDDARGTQPEVLLEIRVLAGHDCLTQNGSDAVVVDDDTPFCGELADLAAVASENPGDRVGLIGIERADLRKIVGISEEDTADSAQERRDQEECDDTRLARHFDDGASALRA